MKNEAITSRDEDFAKWYTDVVRAAKLADYTSVKGCIAIEPNGYAIWEKMQQILDDKFKELGHVNVRMPLIIPEDLLNKESGNKIYTQACADGINNVIDSLKTLEYTGDKEVDWRF